MSHLLHTASRMPEYERRFNPALFVDVEHSGLNDIVGGVPITLTRATPAWAFKSGVLTPYASNEARIVTSPVGVQALLREIGSTNKCTNFNANPPDLTGITFTNATNGLATLAIENDPAGLAAAGLNLVCTTGNVYRLNNGSGDTAAYATFPGATGNVNPHSFSIYARGGTGAVGQNLTTAPDKTTFASAAVYTRRSHSMVPANTARLLQVQVDAGQDVLFVLNQLEEQPIETTPIVTTGATATRNTEVITAPFALTATSPVTLFADYCHGNDEPSTATLQEGVLVLDDGTINNRRLLYRSAVAVLHGFASVANVTQFSGNVAGAVLKDTRQRAATRLVTNDGIACRNGVLSAADVAMNVPATTTMRLGQAQTNTSTDAALQLYLHRVAIYRSALTNAQLQSLTS